MRGALIAGSPSCRLLSRVNITLHGARPNSTRDTQPPWYKGIDVANGTLELHGARYHHTWSRLAASAFAGESTLLLQDAVNWDVGMEVLVTTTQLKDARDWHQNEVFTVARLAAASHLGPNVTALTLSGPLRFDHYGGPEYQAEVGLLTRRVVVQGAPDDSEPTDTAPLACHEGSGSGSSVSARDGLGGYS